jgi:ABC-type glutathione transport system ATPase component
VIQDTAEGRTPKVESRFMTTSTASRQPQVASHEPETPLLSVRDLRVAFNTPDGVLEAVRGISFSVDRGQVLGIVGESGSGKSVATQTMVGLTRGARVTGEAAEQTGSERFSLERQSR